VIQARRPAGRYTQPSSAGYGSMMPSRYRVVDLFAGCGGITEGFRRTGRYRSVAAVELEVSAAATYAENFGEDHIHQGSIVDWLNDQKAPEADVVVGGPPCQGFSNLGAKREDDPRNELWREYVRVLSLIRPKAFVIENVPRFLNSRQFADLEAQAENGSLSEYFLEPRVLVAADFGSAQIRRRGIVIGTHRDLRKPIEIPDPTVAVEERTYPQTAGICRSRRSSTSASLFPATSPIASCT
jgi:DNA (cytosine-5)-methyltransferase 1